MHGKKVALYLSQFDDLNLVVGVVYHLVHQTVGGEFFCMVPHDAAKFLDVSS